jgi:hypothetical protein
MTNNGKADVHGKTRGRRGGKEKEEVRDVCCFAFVFLFFAEG